MKPVLTLAFAWLLAATGAHDAQAQTSAKCRIHGRVIDIQGTVLPGVIVTARSREGANVKTAVSDGAGHYELPDLMSAHAYTVSAELDGFSSFVRPNVDVAAAQSLTLDIQLEPRGVTETVQVLGDEVTRSRNSVERLQDVPLSISVVQGKDLARFEATGIAAVTQRAANVSWNFGNQRTSSLSIRGIGRQGQTEAQDPSVGVIVDGVNYAYNALTSSYDFTDVDTVEVTRGPQGTLLGKNTSLGVINVTTKRPVFTPSTDASLTLGQYGSVLARVAAGGPITEKVAWRGTFSASKIAGDIQNVYNRDITYTNTDRISGRVQLLLVPRPDVSVRIATDFQPRGSETTNGRTINTPTPSRYANGTPTNLNTDPSTRLARRWFTQQGTYTYERDFLYGGGQNAVNNDIARGLVTGSNGASVELNWVRGEHALTSITAYKNYHFNAVNDEGTPFDIHRNAGGFWNDYEQRTQELRLGSQRWRLADYQVGLFLIDVLNDVDYQRIWGSDAGAWFATPAQYARLDATSAGRYLMQNSLDRLSMAFNSPAGLQHIRNRSRAFFAQANWRLTPSLVVTTGARVTREDRRNTGSTFIRDQGNAPELNPVAVNGVSLGGFASDRAGVLTPGNSHEQLRLADALAATFFGAQAPGAPGDAYNGLSAEQRQQVADAKAIRAAQIGVLFHPTEAEPFRAIQPSYVISPLYRINGHVNVYVSWQYGEKAGIAQFTNGLSQPAEPERSHAYEWGVKAVLFGRTLRFNADLFLTDIENYQQSVRILDLYTTTLNDDGLAYYTSATGNVPKVRAKGVEIDAEFAGIRNTSLRFAGAYNDARYRSFPNSAQPVEHGYSDAPPYRDVSGERLPGAALWTFNVGADHRVPAFGDKELHASVNTTFSSRYRSDTSLSDFSWIPARSVTDVAVGIGRRDGRFDITVLVKNVFNDRTPQTQTQTWNSYTPAVPRWFGVQFTGRL